MTLPKHMGALSHHSEVCFTAAIAAVESGEPPVQLVFDTKPEMVAFRQTLHKWRAAHKEPRLYTVTIQASTEEPWTLTFVPRFSQSLASQISKLAERVSQVNPSAPEVPLEVPQIPTQDSDSASERLLAILKPHKEDPDGNSDPS